MVKEHSTHYHSENTSLDHIIFYLTLLVVVASSLAFSTQVYHVFAIPKATLFKVGVSICAIPWGVNQLAHPKRSIDRLNSLLTYLILSFFTVYCFTSFTGVDTWMSFTGSYGRFIGVSSFFSALLVFLIISSSPIKHSQKKSLIFLYSLAIIYSIHALLKYYGVHIFNLPAQSRIHGLSGNANFLSNLISNLSPLALFYLSRAKNLRTQVFHFIVFLLFLYVLKINYGRAGLITFFVINFSYFLYLFYHTKKSLFNILNLLGFFLIFCFISFAYSWLQILQNLSIPFFLISVLTIIAINTAIYYLFTIKFSSSNIKNFLFILIALNILGYVSGHFLKQSNDKSIRYFKQIANIKQNSRYLLWRDSLKLIKNNVFLGVGPENYRSTFLPYKSYELARFLGKDEHDNPHNNYLFYFATTGILGLFSFLSIFLFSFTYLYKQYKCEKSSNKKSYMVLYGALLGAYFLWGMSGFDTTITLGANFLIFALINRATKKTQPTLTMRWLEKFPKKFNLYFQKTFIHLSYLLLFIICSTSIITFSSYFIADKYFQKSYVYFHHLTSSNNGQPKNIAYKYLGRALKNIQFASFLNDRESYYFLFWGKFLLMKLTFHEDPKVKDYYINQHNSIIAKAEAHAWAPEGVQVEKLNSLLIQKQYLKVILTAEKLLKLTPYFLKIRKILEKLYVEQEIYKNFPHKIDYMIKNSEILLRFEGNRLLSLKLLFFLYLKKGQNQKAYSIYNKTKIHHPSESKVIQQMKKHIGA